MSRGIFEAESHERNLPHGMKGSARSIRSLDTGVLMAETDWRPQSRTACETWRSEATVDTGLLMQDPETFVSIGYGHTKPRYTETLESLSVGGANKTSDERDYFQTPMSSYTRPVFGVGVDVRGTDRSDVSERDNRAQRRSAGFEMDDFVSSSGSTTLRDLSPRTNASLDTKILLRDPDENLDYRTQTGHYGLDSDQHFSDYSSELDEDDSSVDHLDDLVSARTVASLTTEVLLKPTEELAQVLGSHKARKAKRPPEESLQKTSNLAELELSSTRAISNGIKSEIRSTEIDKLTAFQHLKTRPPASNSFHKDYDIPSSRISSQRQFSDQVLDDSSEASAETTSTVSNGEGMNSRGTRNNVELDRMQRAFSRRFALENHTPHSDSLQQRSKFNHVQRSKSASRSRTEIAGPSSVFDSPRSVETAVSLGKQIVMKSQENKKKMRQGTAAENRAMSQSFTHDDESSSVCLQKSTFGFHNQSAKSSTKKKKTNHGFNRVQEDVLDGALGLTVMGSPVQTRPLSSSSSLQEMAANEWIRRKKYNPRQSLQTEASLKRTGKPEGKPAQRRSATVTESQAGQRNIKHFADSGGKNAPSTSSDWTDDEEQQQIPCRRDLSAVCQASARVKRLSGQLLQVLRKRPEFEFNEILLRNSEQTSYEADSVETSSPEFLFIIDNLEMAERQMLAVFKALSSEK